MLPLGKIPLGSCPLEGKPLESIGIPNILSIILFKEIGFVDSSDSSLKIQFEKVIRFKVNTIISSRINKFFKLDDFETRG